MTQADMGLLAHLRRLLFQSERPQELAVTPRAERIIELARKGAADLQQAPTLQHLAIALFGFYAGVARNVMLRWPIDIAALRQAVAAHENTTPLKSLIGLAWDEQRRLGHTYLGTEHLFLALIHHRENAAAQFLEQQGLDLTKAREQVLKELDPNFTG